MFHKSSFRFRSREMMHSFFLHERKGVGPHSIAVSQNLNNINNTNDFYARKKKSFSNLLSITQSRVATDLFDPIPGFPGQI